MNTPPITTARIGTGNGRRGRPMLYGEPTVRRSVDIPTSLHTMLQRLVAERNFKAGKPVTSSSQVIVDQLYDFFGLDNPTNG